MADTTVYGGSGIVDGIIGSDEGIDGINFLPVSSLTQTPGQYFKDLNGDVIAHLYWQATDLTAASQDTDVVLNIIKAGVHVAALDTREEEVTALAPALKTTGATKINSASNAVDATLGSGAYIGQTKRIVMTEASNSSTVSVALHETFDPEVFTFDAVDEYLVLEWSGTEWVTIKSTATV